MSGLRAASSATASGLGHQVRPGSEPEPCPACGGRLALGINFLGRGRGLVVESCSACGFQAV